MPTTQKANPNGVCLKHLKLAEQVGFRDAKVVDHLVVAIGGEENKLLKNYLMKILFWPK